MGDNRLLIEFPNELLLEVVSFMDYHDIANFIMTCSVARDVGMMYLNSLRSLISAFWLFCRYHKYEWISVKELKQIVALNSYDKSIRTILCHNAESSQPFIIRCESGMNILNAQLSFAKEIKKLFMKCSTKTMKGEIRTLCHDFSNNSCVIDDEKNDSQTFQNQESLPITFNCYQPLNHSFGCLIVQGAIYYYYDIKGTNSYLKINSQKNVRVVQVMSISKLVWDITFWCCGSLVKLRADFDTIKILHQKWKSILKNDSNIEICIIDDMVFDGFRLIDLESSSSKISHPPFHWKCTFENKVEYSK
jgi:hypothetical protein